MNRLIPLILLLPALAFGAYPDPYNVRIIQSDADGNPVPVDIDGSAHVGKALGFSGLGVLGPLTISAGVSDGNKTDVTVSGSGATWTINAGVVTAAKMALATITAAQIAPAAGIAMSQLAVDPTNASNLSSGTIPDGRFPATLPAASGVNLTALNASNLGSGTVPDARFPATLPASSGANLTALNASNLANGTVPDARFPATLPAASGANLTSLNATNLSSGTIPDARFPATLPAASGGNLTALNASNLSSGTLPVARIGTGDIGPTQLAATAVTAGSYTSANITVDADGRITAAANGSGGGGFTTAAFTGTGSYSGSNPGTIYAGTLAGNVLLTLSVGTGQSAIFSLDVDGPFTVEWDDPAQRIGYGGGTIDELAFTAAGQHTLIFENDGVRLTVKDSYVPKVNLASDVEGVLPLANGGTGQDTAQEAIDALLAASGTLAQGDVFFVDSNLHVVRLPAGTAGYLLSTNGAGNDPSWIAPPGTGSIGTFIHNFTTNAPTETVLTNQSATLLFYAGTNTTNGQWSGTKLDLTDYTEARLVVRRGSTAGATGSRVLVRYRTTYSGTSTDWSLALGTTEIAVPMDTVTNTVAASSWITLAAGAKADVFVALMMDGGDGTADPANGAISLQVR